MLTIFVIVPLLVAAFIAVQLHGRRSAGYVALAASVLSLLIVLSCLRTTRHAGHNMVQRIRILFIIETTMQQLNAMALLIVAAVTPIAITYSIGFMNVPSEQRRYYFEICIFAASMMLFAVSSNFLTLLVSWELLSLGSYLLIGFWYRNERAQTAARKAIAIVLIGDALVFAATLLVWHTLQHHKLCCIVMVEFKPDNHSSACADSACRVYQICTISFPRMAS